MGAKKPLAMQEGDLTVEKQKLKQMEEEAVWVGNEQLEKVPEWLIDDIARKEWKRLVKEFNKKSMISNLDYNNLGAYCNAFSKYTELEKKIGKKFTIGKETNPLIHLEMKYSDEMKKYGGLLGLTIESRLKIGSVIVGNDEEKIENNFGDI